MLQVAGIGLQSQCPWAVNPCANTYGSFSGSKPRAVHIVYIGCLYIFVFSFKCMYIVSEAIFWELAQNCKFNVYISCPRIFMSLYSHVLSGYNPRLYNQGPCRESSTSFCMHLRGVYLILLDI